MHRLISLLCLPMALSNLSVCLLYSALTPFNMLQVQLLADWTVFSLTSVLILTREDISEVEAEVIVDYLYEEGLSAVA